VKPLRTAIVVGAASAIVTWICLYAAIHEPTFTSRRLPDGPTELMLTCQGTDDDLRTLPWAALAYVLVFTPTLLVL
jgi:hypothetical protein